MPTTDRPPADAMPQRRLLPLPDPADPPVPEFPGEHVALGAQRLYVRRTPGGVSDDSAHTAVYVHGLGGNSTNWTDLMHVLSRRLRGIAVDMPGFGQSDPPPDGGYGPGAHAKAVTQLIEAEATGPVHLFGNSLGGAVSTLIASRRPDLVASLTLISPAMPFLRPRREHLGLATGLFSPVRRQFQRQIASSGRDPAEYYTDLMYRVVYADPSTIHEVRKAAAIDEARRRASVPWVNDAFAGSLRALVTRYGPGPANLWNDARKVTAPTLVILGSQDRLVDVRVAGTIALAYRRCRIVIESDVGHVSQMERPASVGALVADRLDEIAS